MWHSFDAFHWRTFNSLFEIVVWALEYVYRTNVEQISGDAFKLRSQFIGAHIFRIYRFGFVMIGVRFVRPVVELCMQFV